VDLSVCHDEMPAVGYRLRSGFALNAQIQKRLRKRFFLVGSKTNESVDSHKIQCDEEDMDMVRPSWSVMWPILPLRTLG
jgi:hypothetical protein